MEKDNSRFIVSVAGKSGSGKTTLLKKLIPELVRKGYRVGTVKHSHHIFEVDKPGKDSWQHREAGAVSVAISSGKRFAFIKELDSGVSIREMISILYKDIDIVLIEGYKNEGFPRIEVVRKGFSKPISQDQKLLMVVSDIRFNLTVPVFGHDEIPGISGLIVEQMQGFYEGFQDGYLVARKNSM